MAFLKEMGLLQGRPAVISGFWPMGDEIDLRPLMTLLHDAGHGIALPVVVGKGLPLIFRAWRPETVLVPGVFGTETPEADAPECVPDILLVPLLAFGRDGARLGYGGGFYDRTLRTLRRAKPVRAIGTAYACQEREGIPMAAWDERLDAVLTEHGVIGTI
jgi:5-formyltetrahydrofolate cyclo-ligase